MRWSFIDYIYNDIPEAQILKNKNSIKILNFIGTYKTWDYNLRSIFPDTIEWYKYWDDIVTKDYKHLSTQLIPMIKTGFPTNYKEPLPESPDVSNKKLIKKLWFFNSLKDGKTPPPYKDILSPYELKLWKNNPLRGLYAENNKKNGGASTKKKASKKKASKKKASKKKSIKKKLR